MSYRLDANDAFHDDALYDEREEARAVDDGPVDRISNREHCIQEGCSRDGSHYREDQ